MRSFLCASAIALGLSACASQTTPPAAPAAAAAPAVKGPQCYNGDAGKFDDVGTVATISGIKVVCEKTTDGKNASWNGMAAK